MVPSQIQISDGCTYICLFKLLCHVVSRVLPLIMLQYSHGAEAIAMADLETVNGELLNIQEELENKNIHFVG